MFEPLKYLQEILHKENGGSIKLISIAHNEEEEMSLNSIFQLWSKIFHLPCTKHVNKDINNKIFFKVNTISIPNLILKLPPFSYDR